MSVKPASPTCSTCRHYWSHEKECRAHPPQVTIIIAPQPGNIATGGRPGMGPVPLAAFPSIGEPGKLGCSEHAPALAIAH